MSSIQQAFIVSALRTPVAKAPRGSFKSTRPDDLLAFCFRQLLAEVPTLDPHKIEDVIVGCAMPEAEQGMNVARIAALLGGLPHGVPAVTVNRFCSSGLQAVSMAAERIQAGAADCVLAGGVESMSLIPMMGHRPLINPAVFDDPAHLSIAYGMGITAENVAERWKVSREDQDAFAWQSHQKAVAAIQGKEFGAEIRPYKVTERTASESAPGIKVTEKIVVQDEGPRSDTTVEILSKLKPAFAVKGSVTAGNSSQMSDGAAAVLVVSERFLKQLGVVPLARYVSFSVAGVDPAIMGIGPTAAIPLALKRAGLQQKDLQWIELNEAFAAQALAVVSELHLDPALINPLGGAIALGHPLGATGAIRTATLVHGMKRRGLRYGMVTMCIGTGMGAAGIFESVS